MAADFASLLLFDAKHVKFSVLSILFPVIKIEVVSLPAKLVISVDPRYQVMVGGGAAFLFITQ